MKRKIISLMLLLLCGGSIWADDNFVANDVEVPQGQTATLEIGLTNTTKCGGFQFLLKADEGISFSTPVKGSRVSNDFTLQGSDGTDGFQVLCYNTGHLSIDGESGIVATFTISADAELTVGKILTGTLSAVQISDIDGKSFTLPDVSFTIKIVEYDPTVVLDENSTTAPTASEGAVPVKVKRTIKAGNWSTICLPFAMTGDQLKSAFGEGVQLGDFTSYDSEYDEGNKVLSITVNFTAMSVSDGLDANSPCLIKTSTDISSFDLTAAVIPEEEKAVKLYDNGLPGIRYVYYGSLIGTYTAQTVVPQNNLFLSGNKFWYSKGATKMKAFRAYFDFVDILTVENSSVKMNILVDGETTRVEGLTPETEDGSIYDLSGRRVEKAVKGVYIINGKKVLK